MLTLVERYYDVTTSTNDFFEQLGIWVEPLRSKKQGDKMAECEL